MPDLLILVGSVANAATENRIHKSMGKNFFILD